MIAGRNPLEVTAYHEAGHIVVAWACGIVVDSVSILPERNASGHRTLGRTAFAFTRDEESALVNGDPIMLRKMVVVGLGGRAADYNYWKHSPTARPDEMSEGNQTDESQVRDLLTQLGHGSEKDYQSYLAVTVHKVGSPGMWSIVDQLAQTLLAHGDLTTSQMTHLSQATPKFDLSFWQSLETIRAGS
jgi:hypothetical protein